MATTVDKTLWENAHLKVNSLNTLVKLLTKLKEEDIKANQWGFLCVTKLYNGTELDHSASTSRKDILRRNIYFLSKQTKGVSTLIVQLCQRTMFSLEVKERLLEIEDDELLLAVLMYGVLLKIETRMFDRMLHIFEQFENSPVADLIRAAVLGSDAPSGNRNSTIAETSSGRKSDPPNPPIEQTGSWSCPHCTFINLIGDTNVCDVCFKTRDSLLNLISGDAAEPFEDEQWEGRSCPVCTLVNRINADFCEACLSPMNENEVNEEPEDWE